MALNMRSHIISISLKLIVFYIHSWQNLFLSIRVKHTMFQCCKDTEFDHYFYRFFIATTMQRHWHEKGVILQMWNMKSPPNAAALQSHIIQSLLDGWAKALNSSQPTRDTGGTQRHRACKTRASSSRSSAGGPHAPPCWWDSPTQCQIRANWTWCCRFASRSPWPLMSRGSTCSRERAANFGPSAGVGGGGLSC